MIVKYNYGILEFSNENSSDPTLEVRIKGYH